MPVEQTASMFCRLIVCVQSCGEQQRIVTGSREFEFVEAGGGMVAVAACAVSVLGRTLVSERKVRALGGGTPGSPRRSKSRQTSNLWSFANARADRIAATSLKWVEWTMSETEPFALKIRNS